MYIEGCSALTKDSLVLRLCRAVDCYCLLVVLGFLDSNNVKFLVAI
jgi:hypothetical protein